MSDETLDVEVYKSGPFCCSVCAPVDMVAEQVQAHVNEIHPCGTENGWTISEDEFLAVARKTAVSSVPSWKNAPLAIGCIGGNHETFRPKNCA